MLLNWGRCLGNESVRRGALLGSGTIADGQCRIVSIHKNEVLRCLKRLQSDGLGGEYVEHAVDYIESHWEDKIRHLVVVRKQIIQIAQTFLFSKHAAHKIRQETATVGGEKEKEGYSLRAGRLDAIEIDNPLRFIEFYSRSKHVSPAESAWLFYVLAFSVRKQ
jgi:hypothetical protein